MKQLLLRVDDELHARLAAQARAMGTSVNALANDILGLGIDPRNLSRRDRLQLTLMALGTIRIKPGTTPLGDLPHFSSEEWDEAVARERERLGPTSYADELIAYERGHDRLP